MADLESTDKVIQESTSPEMQSVPQRARLIWLRQGSATRVKKLVNSPALPVFLAIVILGVYASIRSPFFLTVTNMQNLTQQIATLGVLAVGMTFLMVAGYFDISVGAVAGFLSVVGAKLALAGYDDPVIVLIIVAVGAAIGLSVGWVVAAAEVSPFILTLGTMSVFLGLGLILSDGIPVALEGNSLDSVGLGGMWLGIPGAGIVLIGALVAGALILRYTRIGRQAYAVGSSPQAAFLAGVPTMRVTMAVFALNGVAVGIAGILLLARLAAGQADVGVGLELQAIAAVVLGGAALTGGRGSIWGSCLGVIFLGEIANAMNILGVAVFYQRLVYGSVLILAVVSASLRERGGSRVAVKRILGIVRKDSI